MSGQKTTLNHKLFAQLKRKNPRQLDGMIQEAHERAFSCIDCLQCANCCTTTGPMLSDKDIQRIAKHLRIKQVDVLNTYVRVDEDGDQVFKTMPCPFLEVDKHCSIYEHRPKACRDYPHTDRAKQHQLLKLHEKNAAICPAVEAVLNDVAAQVMP